MLVDAFVICVLLMVEKIYCSRFHVESMVLYGGFPTEIDRGTTKNITYVFSNMYPLDRIGSCKFHLEEIGDTAVLHEVYFNTSTTEVPGSWLEALYDGGPKVWKDCGGVDLNWRNSCQPYDCQKRYNGFRSFFRAEKKKCEPVTVCTTRLDEDDHLPTTAFDYENNRCKDLVPHDLSSKEKNVASDILDEGELAKKTTKYMEVNPDDLFLNCNHGRQVGTFCRCDKGWRSVAVSTENGGTKMNWCSKFVKNNKFKPHKAVRISILTVLILVVISLFVLVMYLWWNLFINEIVVPQKNRSDSDGF